MKRTIDFLLALLTGVVLIVGCATENAHRNTSILIKGEGFQEEFKQVTLQYFDPHTLGYLPLDSQLLAADDQFEFEIPFESPNLYELNFEEKEFIPISVENPGPISVERINGENKIEGSASTQRIALFRKQNEQLQAKYFGQLKIDMDKAMAENDQEEIEALTQQSEILIEEFLQEFRALLITLGTTPAAYYALQFSDFNKEIAFLEQRLLAFKKEAPGSIVTQALEKQVNQAKSTSIGNIPPPFEAETNRGNVLSLADYKGKTVLIDFWAAWCRACRVENPKLAVLYEKYQAKNFTIISISQDESEADWLQSIEKDGIDDWAQIRDKDRSLSTLYSISSLPQNILLDKSGKIIAKNITADELALLLADR